MKPFLVFGFVGAANVLICAQAIPLPADIDAQSFSRLPLVSRAQLDGHGQRIYDAINGKDAAAAVDQISQPANAIGSNTRCAFNGLECVEPRATASMPLVTQLATKGRQQ